VRRRLSGQSGFTMVELLVVMVLMAIIMGGVVDVLVSGSRAGANANARLDAQQNVRVALDRLEFEGRCATSATVISSGAGVSFTLPAQCSNATGTVTWCVNSGVLTRFTTATCGGTGQVYVENVTSPTPFSLVTASGDLPRLDVSITSNEDGSTADAATLTDTITLRNAPRS
jgi:prepilin-type N-terminal cleavage/methylation domain-containing protein